MLARSFLAVAIVAVLPGVALAQSARDRQEKACQADAMKFCKDYVPDEDKIAACMGQHRKELSVPCGIMFDQGAAR